MSRPSSPCGKCGEPAYAGGQPPIGGVRYCRRTAKCRGAKRREQRERYRARALNGAFLTEDEENLDTRPCSCCGAVMPSRARRKYDHPEGRWCRQLKCQKHKVLTLSRANLSEEERLREALFDQTMADRINEAPQVRCSRCGRGNAPDGWMHPTPDFSSGCPGPVDSEWRRPTTGAMVIVWPSVAKVVKT